MVLQWTLLLFLLVCSGIVSGSETALFGLSRLELRSFASGGGTLEKRARQLMQHPRRVLMTVLVANTAVNVLFFTISFILFERIGRTRPLAASVGGVAALLAVILFGEILPKAVARAHAARFAPLVAPLVHGLQTVLAPVHFVLRVLLVEPLTRLLQPPRGPQDEVTVDELRALVEMSAHRGTIDSAENRMLQEIVALPGISVRSIMKPRVDVLAVPLDARPQQIRDKLRQTRLTKLPVYGRNLDDVRGLIYTRDLYLQEDVPLAQLIRPVNFVPEQITLVQLIEHFRASRSQLAIVVDEYGGMAGLVALQDVLTQIVGDLPGPQAPPEPTTEAIDDHTYRLAGDLSIHDWAQQLGALGIAAGSPPPARVQTLAGLVLAELGRWPRQGDSVRIHNLTLTVERMVGRRIDRILLRREPQAEARQAPRGLKPAAGEDDAENRP
jgi:CBS domain containing-hemolysin-like protein